MFLAPQVILSRPERNNDDEQIYNQKIKLYTNRIKAFRDMDADNVLLFVTKIIEQQKKYIEHQQKQDEKLKNVNDHQKKKSLEKRMLNKMKKCLKFGS